MKRTRKTDGFTLIELITVMAITAILLTIIAVPLIQSFNLTRAAQGFANAQSKARVLVAKIEDEVSNAAGVRDNTGNAGSLDVPVPGADGTTVLVRLPYTKLDILKVAAGDPASRVGTAYIDPDTGKADPTLKAPKGQPSVPAVPGTTIVRYFVGLRNPFAPYTNPYAYYQVPSGQRWLTAQAGRDNLFVLYRAEVPLYVWKDNGSGPQLVLNSAYFVDPNRLANTPAGVGIDDPDFFINDGDDAVYTVSYPGDAPTKQERVNNWLKAARVETELSRYDMILPKYDLRTLKMTFDGNIPELVSLVRFQPTRVAQETAEARLAISAGEETENAVNIGASVFDTQYKNWADVRVRAWLSDGPGGTGPLGQSAGRPVSALPVGALPVEMYVNFSGDRQVFVNNNPIFNESLYKRLRANGSAYPMTQAVGVLGGLSSTNFMPMVVNDQTGKIETSFPIQEWGQDAGVPYQNRIPSTGGGVGILTGPSVTPATPAYDPAQTGGLAWNTFSSINERFAVQYNLWDSLFPGGTAPSKDGPLGPKRFVDLRVTPQSGASNYMPPLFPSGGLVRCQIVPGSLEIYGPDQRPGPNYGKTVRYDEVPNSDAVSVGPNQFKANYTYKANEPDWAGLFGFGGVSYDPTVYNANDFLEAVIQPRYRPGYVEFNSNYGEPLPDGNIFITYRFQFTDSKTVMSVDYDSGELMEVVLTIRNYTQSNLPNPQMVTVKGSAAVRNALR